MTQPAGDTYLLHLVGALRRRWLIVVLCLVAAPAVSLAVSLGKTKQYQTSADVLFKDTRFDQALFGTSATPASDPTRQAATNLRLIQLGEVAVRTAHALGLSVAAVQSAVQTSAEGDADLASVTATWSDPRFAARLANTYVREFIDFRRQSEQSQLADARSVVELQLAQLTPAQRVSADGQALAERANQLRVLAALQTGDAELVSPAAVPDAPSSPRPVHSAVLGAALGLVLGIALALLLDRLDARVREAEAIRRALRVPVLAAVPAARRRKGDGLLDPRTADVFRAVHANLRYFEPERDLRCLLLTSPGGEDGRSAVAAQLAAAAAESGTRVLLVRADLRSAESPTPGLTTVLAHAASLGEVVVRSEVGAGTLDVLEPGPAEGAPTQLLASARMGELVESSRLAYDLVVIDGPPLGVLPDGIPLAKRADGVLVAVRSGRHSARALAALRSQLDHLGVAPLGAVVTGARASVERSGPVDLSPTPSLEAT